MAIPNELKEQEQWCFTKPSSNQPKAPFNPLTGELAAVNDPTTWGTYDQARDAAHHVGGRVGFVLTAGDPYIVIDLDAPENDDDHRRIDGTLKAFDYTYTEVSQSGRGYHILGKGQWPPEAGNRRGKLEVYDQGRFVILTGDVYEGRDTITNFERVQLDELRGLLGDKRVAVTTDQRERLPDNWVEAAARNNREDGHIFTDLYDTPWADMDGDKSAHDMSLANLLARWTGNADQFIRLWERSARWRPEDKRNGNVAQYERYLLETFQKARASMQDTQFIPYWMIDHGRERWECMWVNMMEKARLEAEAAEQFAVARVDETNGLEILRPPGLVGNLAAFIYQRAPRPVWEIAVAGAIGILAGIAGRKYNYSDTGLNQYVIYIAPSGIGKDAVAKAASTLPRTHEKLAGMSAFIGKRSYTGGSAIFRELEQQPSVVAIFDEVGHLLTQMKHQKANSGNTGGDLYPVLLGLYARSGAFDVYEGRGYARKEDTIQVLQSPAFSLVGSSNPDTFYKALNTELGKDGFTPRLLVIDVSHTKRPPRNRGAPFVTPSQELIDGMGALLQRVAQPGMVIQVQATAAAEALLDALDTRTDDAINALPESDPQRPILNRTHLKALRLAALVAVGVNPERPVIDEVAANWAINLVEHGDRIMLRKIATGEVGGGESADLAVVRKTLLDWPGYDPDKRREYGATKEGDTAKHLVPFRFVYMRLKHKFSDKSEYRAGAKTHLQSLMSAAEVMGWVEAADLPTKTLHGYQGKTDVFMLQDRLFQDR